MTPTHHHLTDCAPKEIEAVYHNGELIEVWAGESIFRNSFEWFTYVRENGGFDTHRTWGQIAARCEERINTN